MVQGPGDLAWRYPVTLTEAGSFYHKFQEKDLPTGTFTAHFEDKDRKNSYGSVAFQVEAYRIPQFEVLLHAPEKASLDQAFDVSLTASYYAGGRVAGQPVHWRVTQFPYSFTLQEARGLPLQLRRALLGRRTLPVDPAPREGRRHEPGGRGQGRPQPDHRAHGRAADLRGRGHGDRSRRPDGDRDPHRARPASVRPRPQGAALPRAREVHRRADARGRPRRRARGGPRGHRAPAAPRVALAPAGQRLHRRRRPLHHGHGRREGPGDDGQERQGARSP